MLRFLGRWPVLRFAGVGGLNTAVHLSVYAAVRPVLPQWAAHLAATVAAMTGSYLLNCRFTFGVLPRARSLLLYPFSHLGSIVVSTAAMVVLVERGGVDGRVATLAGGLCALPVTFLLARGALTGGVPDRVAS